MLYRMQYLRSAKPSIDTKEASRLAKGKALLCALTAYLTPTFRLGMKKSYAAIKEVMQTSSLRISGGHHDDP
jgi:hypothetical protein